MDFRLRFRLRQGYGGQVRYAGQAAETLSESKMTYFSDTD
jgi:hypothetical protein